MTSGPLAPRRGWAVVIGINGYEDRLAYPRLGSCVRDAIAMYALLTHPHHTNLAKKHVSLWVDGGPKGVSKATERVTKTLLSHDSLSEHEAFAAEVPRWRKRPTRDNLLAEVNRAAHYATRDDLLLIYFAGHAAVSNGEVFLIPRTARPTKLKTTAVSLDAVKEEMRKSNARHKVLLLDACYSGSHETNRQLRMALLARSSDVAVFASSLPWEGSHEVADGHGVFTKYLLEGLSGKAADGRSGQVTLDSLTRYVIDEVSTWVAANIPFGHLQTPTLNDTGKRKGRRIVLSGQSMDIGPSSPAIVSARRQELDVLHEMFESHAEWVLLHGEPGCGKSALATEFEEYQTTFDRVIHQECRLRPDGVCQHLRRQLDAEMRNTVDTSDARRLLVILDNVDGPRLFRNVERLLSGYRGTSLLRVAVLTTSRISGLRPRTRARRFRRFEVENFSRELAEAVFQGEVSTAVWERTRELALPIAGRLDYSPAVVGEVSEWLARERGASRVRTAIVSSNLKTSVRHARAALRRLAPRDQQLLVAMASCSEHQFCLSLACEIARLRPEWSKAAADRLVAASLLRTVDHDKQEFKLRAVSMRLRQPDSAFTVATRRC